MTSSPKLKILVTGGAGFIGTHLCRQLVAHDYAVQVLDLRMPEAPLVGVNYVQGDVRDLSLVSKLLDEVTTVFHLAALVSIPLCQKNPIDSYSTNFTGTLTVLEAIRKQAEVRNTSPIRLAFASTAALYGTQGDDGRALKESDIAPHFQSFYAAQKHASEQALNQYRLAFGVPSIPFRFFNVFGPGQDPASPYSGVITAFMHFAKTGKPLPLNAGGTQTRDFIAVQDIVAGLLRALEVPLSRWDAQAINLGTGTSIEIHALAEIISQISGANSPLLVAPAREGDITHSKADISRAREILGFTPQCDLRGTLSELLTQPAAAGSR